MRNFVELPTGWTIDAAQVEAVFAGRPPEGSDESYCFLYTKSGNRFQIWLSAEETLKRLGLKQ